MHDGDKRANMISEFKFMSRHNIVLKYTDDIKVQGFID